MKLNLQYVDGKSDPVYNNCHYTWASEITAFFHVIL